MIAIIPATWGAAIDVPDSTTVSYHAKWTSDTHSFAWALHLLYCQKKKVIEHSLQVQKYRHTQKYYLDMNANILIKRRAHISRVVPHSISYVYWSNHDAIPWWSIFFTLWDWAVSKTVPVLGMMHPTRIFSLSRWPAEKVTCIPFSPAYSHWNWLWTSKR